MEELITFFNKNIIEMSTVLLVTYIILYIVKVDLLLIVTIILFGIYFYYKYTKREKEKEMIIKNSKNVEKYKNSDQIKENFNENTLRISHNNLVSSMAARANGQS